MLQLNYWFVSEKFGFETFAVWKESKNKLKKKRKKRHRNAVDTSAWGRASLFLMLSDFTRVANVTAAKFAPIINPTAYKRRRHLEAGEQTAHNVMKM